MSLGFVFVACAFALVVGCAVACVDRWREGRLSAVPRRTPKMLPDSDASAAPPATHRRAA
jgi:hypothetical protein